MSETFHLTAFCHLTVSVCVPFFGSMLARCTFYSIETDFNSIQQKNLLPALEINQWWIALFNFNSILRGFQSFCGSSSQSTHLFWKAPLFTVLQRNKDEFDDGTNNSVKLNCFHLKSQPSTMPRHGEYFATRSTPTAKSPFLPRGWS